MKVSYSSLQCPHCGSKKFNLVEDDVFLCEYCNNKFNFNLEELDFSSENKIFRNELKERFENKILALRKEKYTAYTLLMYYKKLAHPKLITTLSSVFLGLSLFITLVIFFTIIQTQEPFPTAFCVTSIILSTAFFIFARVFKNIRYNKYGSYVSHYAKKVVEYENEINSYINLVSKLSD